MEPIISKLARSYVDGEDLDLQLHRMFEVPAAFSDLGGKNGFLSPKHSCKSKRTKLAVSRLTGEKRSDSAAANPTIAPE